MNALTFDTHEAAKTVEEAGFTKAQVEALVDVSRRTTGLPDTSDLVTKAHLSSEVSGLRAEIERAKVQVISIILGAMAAMTAIGAVLAKLIH